MRVALFVGCYNDTLFPEAGKAVVTLLERLGHEVAVPREQTCCGQMHLNTGYREQALALARRFTRVFAEYEHVVSPAASCVSTVRERYLELSGDDPETARLVPRVLELSELLVGTLGLEDVGATFRHRVVFHRLELVELADAEECCGFGGTFAVKNAAVSTAMLADKISSVLAADAEILCASDSSCLMHIGGGLRRTSAPVRTVHLAEILAS